MKTVGDSKYYWDTKVLYNKECSYIYVSIPMSYYTYKHIISEKEQNASKYSYIMQLLLCKIITISILLTKYHLFRKEIQKECCKAYTNYVSNLVNNNDHVNKKLQPFIKARGRITALLHHFNTTAKYIMTIQLTVKTDILNKYFTSVFTQNTDTTSTYTRAPFPDISPITINCDEVAQLLATLDVHKATGPDPILSHLLKEISSEIAPSLTLLF